MVVLIIIAGIIAITTSQSCIAQNGQPVEWWIVFKVPPKIGVNAYAYYDANMKTGEFQYYGVELDVAPSPLTNTIDVFNSDNFSRVAWNDEKPSGQVSSSAAHSKGFIGFSHNYNKGFFVSHSIPKYPSFTDGKIEKTIAAAQQIYGQHLACFSMTLNELEILASNLLVIKPYIYQGQVENTAKTQNLLKLAQGAILSTPELFYTANIKSALNYNIMSIYKNYKVNGSIFQDGLTSFLGATPLIAETWGRPLASAWCSEAFQVKNALQIKVGDVFWNESDDHSKWVLAGDQYACFGDMNRMNSQWKRGGAFYCLSDKTLIAAVKKTVINHDGCTKMHLSRQ